MARTWPPGWCNMRNKPDRRIRRTWLVLLLVALPLFAGCGGTAKPPSAGTAPATRASTPAPSSPYHFRFIVCGDPQNNYEVFNKVLEAAKGVDFLIIAGDLTGSGTKTEFSNFVQVMKDSGVKYYCVPGNHDVAVSPVTGNYTTYLGAPHQSFDFQNSHFILIDDSTPDQGFYPAEQQWAKADLAAADKKGFEHIFAIAHVPSGFPYSGNPKDSDVQGIRANDELVPVLSDGGVQELFCGHLHLYEQYQERDMTITITGGAGAPLHTANGYHNYVLVDVNGKQYDQQVIRID